VFATELAREFSAECMGCERSEGNISCSELPRAEARVCEQGRDPVVTENVNKTSSGLDDNDNNDVYVEPRIRAKSFSFLHWNIHGFATKMFDVEFISFINSFDFICLVETFVEDFSVQHLFLVMQVCVVLLLHFLDRGDDRVG
jgi:hypothetical protein